MAVPTLLKVSAVIDALGFSKRHVYELINQGEIPHVRIGGAIRVVEDDLARFIEQHRSAAA